MFTLEVTSRNGTVHITPEQPENGYPEGTAVTLTCTPVSDDYRFLSFTGSQTITGNPATIIMDSDKTIEAVFIYTDNKAEAIKTELQNAWHGFMKNTSASYYKTEKGELLGWKEGPYLNAYIYGYLVTKERIYLDKIVEHTYGLFKENTSPEDDYPLTFESPGRIMGTEVEYPQAWGWYGLTYTKEGAATSFDTAVGEGMMLKAITLFIETVFKDPDLHNDYLLDAVTFLNEYIIEKEMAQKWDKRGLYKDCGNGAAVYKFHNHEDNFRHNSSMANNQMMEFCHFLLNMWRITQDIWYRDHAAKVMQHLKMNFYTQGGITNWNYWDHAGLWDYVDKGTILGKPNGYLKTTPREDHRIGYKYINVGAIVDGYRHGIVFDQDDVFQAMERFNIYRDNYNATTGQAAPLSVDLALVDKDYAIQVLESVYEFYKIKKVSFQTMVTIPKALYFMAHTEEPGFIFHDVASHNLTPMYDKFNGSTTDFKNQAEITAVSNVVLEIEGKGKLEFGAQPLNMANHNLDAYVTLDDNLVVIDGDKISELNVPCTITLYGLNYEDPKIIESGKEQTRAKVITNVPGDRIVFTVENSGTYFITRTAGGSILFSDDFETGDFSNWNPRHLNLGSISSKSGGGVVFEGEHSFQVALDGSEPHNKLISSQVEGIGEVYEQFTFKLSEDFKMENKDSFSLSHHFGEGRTLNNSVALSYGHGSFYLSFQYKHLTSDGKGATHHIPGNGYYMQDKIIQPGIWYTVEYHFKPGEDKTMIAECWLNGEFLGRKREGNTSTFDISYMELGVMYAEPTTRGTIIFDNWKMSDEYIGMAKNTLITDRDYDGMADDWEQQIIDADPDDDILFIENVLPREDYDKDRYSNLKEFLAGTSPIDAAESPRAFADFDSDADSDGFDLGLFILDFNRKDFIAEPSGCPADLDNDGDVDEVDLFLLSEDFGYPF